MFSFIQYLAPLYVRTSRRYTNNILFITIVITVITVTIVIIIIHIYRKCP